VQHGDVMVRASRDWDRRFYSRSFHYHVMTFGKLFTHVPLSSSSIIWYWPKGGGDALQLVR